MVKDTEIIDRSQVSDDYGYWLVGGANYRLPETGNPEDQKNDRFDSFEAAVNEWLRRRNDWTGRFPNWGEGVVFHNDPENSSFIVFLGDESQSYEGWTLQEALSILDRSDELPLYVDIS